MNQNLISANLSDEDTQGIMEAIKTIQEKLPFLIGLSAKERREVVKMGDKSRTFVEKTKKVAAEHIEFLPRFFDLEEFEQDLQLLSRLDTIQIALSQLNEKIDDTLMAAGSDALKTALDVYAHIKISGTGEGLDELKAMMSRRFSKNSRTEAESSKGEV